MSALSAEDRRDDDICGKQLSSAPSGLLNFLLSPTQGASRGPTDHTEARKGRKKLVPAVALVINHMVLLQKRYKFLPKRMLPMVLFLIRNIFRDCRNT